MNRPYYLTIGLTIDGSRFIREPTKPMSFQGPFYKNRASKFLTPAHLRALGRVAAEWGILEWVLRMHGSALIKSSFGVLTGNPGGVRHAEILIILVPTYLRHYPKTAAKVVAALKKVEALGKRRNDLLHAGWGVTFEMRGTHPVLPEKEGKAHAAIFRGRGRAVAGLLVTAADIARLAKEIGDVRIAINKALFPLSHPFGHRSPLRGPLPPKLR